MAQETRYKWGEEEEELFQSGSQFLEQGRSQKVSQSLTPPSNSDDPMLIEDSRRQCIILVAQHRITV